MTLALILCIAEHINNQKKAMLQDLRHVNMILNKVAEKDNKIVFNKVTEKDKVCAIGDGNTSYN